MSDRVELVGEPEAGQIELVAYDPRCARRFEQERMWILAALGPAADGVDHIGSTAVYGLRAKPIVDLTISVQDPADEGHYLPALERRLSLGHPRT